MAPEEAAGAPLFPASDCPGLPQGTELAASDCPGLPLLAPGGMA